MRKIHLVRIVISALFSAMAIKTVSVVINLDTSNLAILILEAKSLGLSGIGDAVRSVQYYIWLWNYSIALILIGAVWRWFGLPVRVLPERFFSNMIMPDLSTNEETVEERRRSQNIDIDDKVDEIIIEDHN